MANVYNYDWFQIAHTGVTGSEATKSAQTREFGSRMSNFGDLILKGRSSDDYTRTTLGFADKDNLSDWNAIKPLPHSQDAEHNDNPYLAGSSLKRIRDDQFVRMGMSMGGNTLGGLTAVEDGQIDAPKFDVSDTDVVSAAGMDSGINYPTEGWRSFGGKYDKPVAYQGL